MAEKTHQPTQRRLRDARRQGEVVFSLDLSSTAVFWVVIAMAALLAPTALTMLQELWLHATSRTLLTQPDDRFGELALHSAEVLLWTTIPVIAVAIVAAVLGSFFQVGGLAAWVRLKPDINRLNPVSGLQNIFSLRNLVKFAKMIVKTLLLAALLYVVIRSYLDSALRLGYLPASEIMALGARTLLVTFAWAGMVFTASAAFDYAHERYEFMRRHRMSDEELRREHKESEGDPTNVARRRSAHFEAIFASIADRARACSVIVLSNRVAVGLQYLGPDDLPRVMVAGEGEVAAQIRRFAAEGGVPEEIEAALAERLYEQAPVDQPVPRALYGQVAQVLQRAHEPSGKGNQA